MLHGSVDSHVVGGYSRYNRRVLRATCGVRSTRRRSFATRIATFVVVVMVAIVGLLSANHAYELASVTPAPNSVSSSVYAAGDQIVDLPASEAEAMGGDVVLGLVTCVLGLLCGLALAILIVFAVRLRLTKLQQLRPRPAPIFFSAAFDHRGRHRFGLFDLGLLRI